MNKGKLKQKFAVLTDNDLMFEEGKKEEMIGSFKLRLAKQKRNCTKSSERFNCLINLKRHRLLVFQE